MVGSFNFPNNKVGKKIWKSLQRIDKTKSCDVLTMADPVYLLVHPNIKHRPMPEDRAIEGVLKYCRVIYSAEELIVVEIR